MKTVFRWGLLYLLLMVGLTSLGYYNQQMNAHLMALQATEADRRQKQTQLLLERYQLISPLALQEWAEAHGYIPMSLARWANPGVTLELQRRAP